MNSLRHVFASLAACLIAGGCTEPAGHAQLRDAALPELLAAQRFAYRGAHTGGHLLSPDGNKIAWTGPSWLRATLFVRDRASGVVRNWRAPGAVQWTSDSRRLLYLHDRSGTENPHVYMIDTESSAAAVDLTPYPGIKAAIHQLSEADPKKVLVTHNRRNPKLFDLYSIDLETGRETLIARFYVRREAWRAVEGRADTLLRTWPESSFESEGLALYAVASAHRGHPDQADAAVVRLEALDAAAAAAVRRELGTIAAAHAAGMPVAD